MKAIKNARILQNGTIKNVNIVYDSKIEEISTGNLTGNYESVINAHENILIPGGIDPHVHFNDPGYLHHENFSSGTQAAAAGGITTIIDMPCTSIPPVTTKENLQTKLKAIAPKAHVDFAFWGGINGHSIQPKQIEELWENGVVGFKIYTISGMKSFSALSYQQIGTLLHKFPHYLFAFHAEDETIIKENLKNQAINEATFAKIRSIDSEFTAVQNILAQADKENNLHFVHISSKKAAQLILQQNKNVTWETCPHYLQFTADDFPRLRGRLKTAPPVKFAEDREFLREQFKNGTLNFAATDHAGCDFATEKNVSDFAKIYNGIPGTQFMLPYLFSEFFHHEANSLATLIKMTSENAAKRYGLYPQKGSLEIGTDADFTIMECQNSYQVDEKKLLSKGKYSPFHDEIFTASVSHTILRGKIVFTKEKGNLAPAGYGKFLRSRE